MTLSEMTTVLGVAAEFFPTVSVTPQMAKAWLILFQNRDAMEFGSAMMAVCAEPGRKFFPTPGELTARLLGVASQSSAEEAWELCLRLASKSLDWDDAEKELQARSRAAAHAAFSVGWDRVRYSDIERELPFIRKNFLSAFESFDETAAARISDAEAKRILERLGVEASAGRTFAAKQKRLK